jgi:hypothetical protein
MDQGTCHVTFGVEIGRTFATPSTTATPSPLRLPKRMADDRMHAVYDCDWDVLHVPIVAWQPAERRRKVVAPGAIDPSFVIPRTVAALDAWFKVITHPTTLAAFMQTKRTAYAVRMHE